MMITIRRVEVWFGDHKIIEYYNEDPGKAADFETAMRRRWPSLKVTNEPVAEELVPQ